ncbi:MAG: hypothetical protein EBV34_13935 [Betaproteobacteria bacterium]|nr:hypothetical protein [Betaproteobacteria bacterium]
MGKSARSELIDLFFRFQSMVQALRSLPGVEGLSPEHEALLKLVGSHWHSGHSLSVREAMRNEAFGSPATIHKRLHFLREIDLIDLEVAENDSRKRIIVPTANAVDYFVAQAKAIKTLTKS